MKIFPMIVEIPFFLELRSSLEETEIIKSYNFFFIYMELNVFQNFLK